MEMLEGLLALAVIHFIATASPGPDFILISKETLSKGRKAGFITLVGTLGGISVHITYSAIGLAAIIAKSPEALLAIQLLGGGYLIYLGILGLKAKPRAAASNQQSIDSKGVLKSFRAGFICDLLNPKAPIYYVSLFTFVLAPDISLAELSIYGTLLMGIHFCWFALVVLLLSTDSVNRKFQLIGHWIDRVLGGTMVAIGVKVLAT
ncbi:LysE family translocator [Neptuniibacter caesariensis]|uniref:RhtB protein n=1 Tax=Neptuniibacter caesariensis TaxID=207954 RepID=A0A7U8GTA0_NEPCE|nr:LysE family translocator [Neptuniibacter caesariensis]EAR62216.1 RhtB protein [Oceanospirillum sp. MED92] [Neptuniibacter caesariensis]